ncbi:hypothetical protein ACIBCR_16270 [Micromonospora echinospora]|uniref:hypothetical protein n=1 Tax=Micromonospora echinospora TaxID=1877 RepID=UPI00378F1B88
MRRITAKVPTTSPAKALAGRRVTLPADTDQALIRRADELARAGATGRITTR